MKVIVLNSGGFDSVVLIHKVRADYPDAEITALFFNHGQRSYPLEKKWSKYHSDLVGATWQEIKLPKFSWTNGKFYEEGYDVNTQYIEWRNLVFMSYAFSVAESIGAEKIFLAVTKGNYKDVSCKFIHLLNLFDDNIEVLAPLKDVSFKTQAGLLAAKYNIEPYTFNSCDVMKKDDKGELAPCGECNDCKATEQVNDLLVQVLEGDFPEMMKFYKNNSQ